MDPFVKDSFIYRFLNCYSHLFNLAAVDTSDNLEYG